MDKMTNDEAAKLIRNYFPEKGVPFIIEVEFTQDFSDEETAKIAYSLMSSMFNGTEIIPGLKVHKNYRQAETLDSLAVSSVKDEVRDIQMKIYNSLRDLDNSLSDLERACERVQENARDSEDNS